jgi:hypothetical protein
MRVTYGMASSSGTSMSGSTPPPTRFSSRHRGACRSGTGLHAHRVEAHVGGSRTSGRRDPRPPSLRRGRLDPNRSLADCCPADLGAPQRRLHSHRIRAHLRCRPRRRGGEPRSGVQRDHYQPRRRQHVSRGSVSPHSMSIAIPRRSTRDQACSPSDQQAPHALGIQDAPSCRTRDPGTSVRPPYVDERGGWHILHQLARELVLVRRHHYLPDNAPMGGPR